MLKIVCRKVARGSRLWAIHTNESHHARAHHKTHLLLRVKSIVTLSKSGWFLPDDDEVEEVDGGKEKATPRHCTMGASIAHERGATSGNLKTVSLSTCAARLFNKFATNRTTTQKMEGNEWLEGTHHHSWGRRRAREDSIGTRLVVGIRLRSTASYCRPTVTGCY